MENRRILYHCLCHFSHGGRLTKRECSPRPESAMGRSAWTRAGFNGSKKLLPQLKCGNLTDHSGISTTLPQQNCSIQQPTPWDSAAFPCAKHVTVVPAFDRVRVFPTLTLLEIPKRGRWHHSLLRPLRDKLETLVQRAEVLLTKAILVPAVQKRMSGRYLLDVFGGSGFLATAANHLGLRGHWSQVRRGKAPCSHQNSTRRLRWKLRHRNDFTSPPRQHTSCSSQSYIRHCGHRKLASLCSHAVDSGTPVCFMVVGRSKNPDSCSTASPTAWAVADVCVF